MATTIAPGTIAGGSFLIRDLSPAEIFTPEDFTDEQRQVAATASQFAMNEVLPAAAQIEAKDFAVTRKLFLRAGELGLLATDIPEQYGGLAMDKTTSSIVADQMAALASFCVALSGHVGIGTLPIVWYGSDEQKSKYLPQLATGELIAAYALSEASSGSDAMNIRTRAALSSDGTHYVLNGEKMWITNAGFADLFTVFAKVDGEKFSAFLIERGTPGLTIGAEEHKLGIRGSSTCPLVLTDCRIPAANLLGEVGKGHQIAFNILNMGRLKLGASCVGGARNSLNIAIRYAKERKAFGKPIAEFGLIQQKIADCAMKVFVSESMAYRTVGMIDEALAALDPEAAQSSREIQRVIERYAVECSILKVWGSEMLDCVVDHVLQIYGGYGYVEEYPAERAYRDARINRIFEGTNEINRLIITGRLMKSALSGDLPLMPAIQRMMSEVAEPPSLRDSSGGEDVFARETEMLANLKKIALFAAGCALSRYMAALTDEQEVMADLADLLMSVYALESALVRARKSADGTNSHGATRQKSAEQSLSRLIVQLYADQAMTAAGSSAQHVLAAAAEGDSLRMQLTILRKLTRYTPVSGIALSRAVAKQVIEAGRYLV